MRASIATLPALLRARRPGSLATTDIATRETAPRVALRSFFVVVLFWWFATGAIFALERNDATRSFALMVASALAVWGAWLLYAERDCVSPSAVRRGFLGGAFLWTWVQVAFYGGWLIGPAELRVAVPASDRSWSVAVQAVHSMLWYQLAMLFVLSLSAALVGSRANRIGWWALLLFWCEHQIASINIFAGVANPGRGFFPPPLSYLESFFGPQHNSWLLPVSIAAVLMFTLRVVVQALRTGRPVRRQAMMLLAVLGALGVLELAVLATPMETLIWDWALSVRGY